MTEPRAGRAATGTSRPRAATNRSTAKAPAKATPTTRSTTAKASTANASASAAKPSQTTAATGVARPASAAKPASASKPASAAKPASVASPAPSATPASAPGISPTDALARHLDWLDFALGAAKSEESWRKDRLAKATKKNRAKREARLTDVTAEIEELTALLAGIRELKARPARSTPRATATGRRKPSSGRGPGRPRKTTPPASPA
jgi:hypothetical protein